MDVPWKYLNFFLDDDKKLEYIGREYQAGRMLTGEIKAELVQVRLCTYIHKYRRQLLR